MLNCKWTSVSIWSPFNPLFQKQWLNCYDFLALGWDAGVVQWSTLACDRIRCSQVIGNRVRWLVEIPVLDFSTGPPQDMSYCSIWQFSIPLPIIVCCLGQIAIFVLTCVTTDLLAHTPFVDEPWGQQAEENGEFHGHSSPRSERPACWHSAPPCPLIAVNGLSLSNIHREYLVATCCGKLIVEQSRCALSCNE